MRKYAQNIANFQSKFRTVVPDGVGRELEGCECLQHSGKNKNIGENTPPLLCRFQAGVCSPRRSVPAPQRGTRRLLPRHRSFPGQATPASREVPVSTDLSESRAATGPHEMASHRQILANHRSARRTHLGDERGALRPDRVLPKISQNNAQNLVKFP